MLPRLIPALLLHKDGLYKSRRFSDLKYVGDPINAIRIFNEKEVDELLLFDIDASKERREPNWSLLEQCAEECFMPFGYGGGVTTVGIAKRVVSLGVEKVVLNAAAWDNLNLVATVASALGSCSTVVCLDLKRNWRGVLNRYNHVTRRKYREEIVQLASYAAEMGAGELILQDVDRDGTYSGPDLDLVRSVCAALSIPVTILGGVGSLDDVAASWHAGASGVAVGSWFMLQRPHRAVLISYPAYSSIREKWETVDNGVKE